MAKSLTVPIDERHSPGAAGQGDIPVSSLNAGPVAVTASWADQDEVLRNLWLAGDSPQQIGEKLNRSVAAIMTRAARLGLPRRFAPGRKPIVRRDLPLAQVRPVIKPSKPAAPDMPAEDKALVARICLMCLTKFPSQGPHNRICSSCKESNDYLAGSRLPDLDFPT